MAYLTNEEYTRIRVQRCRGCVTNYVGDGGLCSLCQSIERHKDSSRDWSPQARVQTAWTDDMDFAKRAAVTIFFLGLAGFIYAVYSAIK